MWWGLGRGGLDWKLAQVSSEVTEVWARLDGWEIRLWTVMISLLADPDGIIPSPRPRQRFPLLLEISFTFGISWGSIYLIRGL